VAPREKRECAAAFVACGGLAEGLRTFASPDPVLTTQNSSCKISRFKQLEGEEDR
jgi:hypothetical protein